jgi:DNA-binding transcriptional LysR family regulator
MTQALTIGVVTGVTADKWLRVWRERLPDVELRLVPVAEGGGSAALADGVELVFARLPLEDAEGVHVIPLWEETPMVVAAKDHPVKVFDAVTLADLADEQLYPGWDDATLDIVAAGHGIARMPQSVFRATGRRDVVARAITDAEPTRIGLAWRATTTGPLVDEFIGIVRGRTANSSRGTETPPAAPKPKEQRQERRPDRRPPRPGQRGTQRARGKGGKGGRGR